MDDNVNQLDACGCLTNYIFDEKITREDQGGFLIHEYPSEEEVYFTQIFVCLFLNFSIKLDFLNLILKKQHFGFRFFPVQYLWINFFDNWLSPSGCLWFVMLWEYWVFLMYTDWHLSTQISSGFYFYQHEQPKFQSLERKLNFSSTSFQFLV